MARQINGDTWGERLTLRIAERVRSVRMAQGMTTQELADRTEKLGHPVSRQAIVNLESGRKAQIGVDDLFMLAHSLAVNPLFLLFDPLLQGSPVELLPSLTVPQWNGLRWATSRPDAISSVLYEGDFDNGRTAISMRSQLDRARSELDDLELRLRTLRENNVDIRDSSAGTLDPDEVSVRIRFIQQQIEEKRASERLLISILEGDAVQMNDRWYSPRVLTEYRKRIWDTETDWDGLERRALNYHAATPNGAHLGFDRIEPWKIAREDWRFDHDVPEERVLAFFDVAATDG